MLILLTSILGFVVLILKKGEEHQRDQSHLKSNQSSDSKVVRGSNAKKWKLKMLEITLTHYLILASAVFILGTVGVIVNRNSVLNIFISVQLMVIGVCINLISFSYFKNNLEGQVFSFFIIIVTAIISSIGLAILIVMFRKKGRKIFEN
jgi:NADH-quinone oxidoreductase subunit K